MLKFLSAAARLFRPFVRVKLRRRARCMSASANGGPVSRSSFAPANRPDFGDFLDPNSLKQLQRISLRACERRGARAQFVASHHAGGGFAIREVTFTSRRSREPRAAKSRASDWRKRPRDLLKLPSPCELRRKRNHPMPAPRQFSGQDRPHESPPSVF